MRSFFLADASAILIWHVSRSPFQRSPPFTLPMIKSNWIFCVQFAEKPEFVNPPDLPECFDNLVQANKKNIRVKRDLHLSEQYLTNNPLTGIQRGCREGPALGCGELHLGSYQSLRIVASGQAFAHSFAFSSQLLTIPSYLAYHIPPH